MVSKFKSGKFIDHHHKKEYQYKSFRPEFINRQFELDADINVALDEANRLLGELNAYFKLVPDVDFFIKMHTFKEANQSSRIEGTKTELDEVIVEKGNISPEKRDDWEEVQNYVRAMNNAIVELESLPFSMRLLKNTHRILLSGVRGSKKSPGEIRTSQNWIGGSGLNDAYFIPPHKDELGDLLYDLECFLNNTKIKIPELVKMAIAHYQFETIHPFLDGNGRIGRLLITLYLIHKKILIKPSLYLSDFFARKKNQYYDALSIPRHSHDLKHWIMFFLNGIIETSKSARNTLEKTIDLNEKCREKIVNRMRNYKKGLDLLKNLYSHPIINTRQAEGLLNSTHQTASKILKELVVLNILREKTGFKRNRIFLFDSYLNLFRDS